MSAQGPSATLAGPGELWLYATRPVRTVCGNQRRVWPAGTIHLPITQATAVGITAA